MSDARAHVNFKQSAIETKTPIEISEAAVGFAGEASAPKIPVSRIAHDGFLRRSRIVQQLNGFRQDNFRLDETA